MQEQIIVAVEGTTVVARAHIDQCRLEFDMHGETYQLKKQPGGNETTYRLSRYGKMQPELVALIYKDADGYVATDTIHAAKGMTPLKAASRLMNLLEKYKDKRFYKYTN